MQSSYLEGRGEGVSVEEGETQPLIMSNHVPHMRAWLEAMVCMLWYDGV